ncbi:hypothetical protein VTL71DRAFT_13075 [Oculimacula yallundae]|uniref:NACHT domain-containing protein n=1 Tax=Oculimacula yallundae TaxID=86028 RepID=A0ABR4CPE4_9HELO
MSFYAQGNTFGNNSGDGNQIGQLNDNRLIINSPGALREAVSSAQHDKERSNLLAWLSSADPSQNYINAQEKFENGGQGTGDWLIRDNQDFGEWKRASKSLIWLNGKAGSGKSVLSSSVIRHLKESYNDDPQIALAYFYFSFNDGQKQTAVGMMESIIQQICCCRPDTPSIINVLRDLMARGQRPTLKELQKVFLGILTGFSGVYVIIDALDECPDSNGDREKLLKCLHLIRQMSPNSLHMFWTSRREKDIETSCRLLQADPGLCDINLSFYKPAINHDMGLLIDSTLASASYKEWPEQLKTHARDKLIGKSDGMFQYVACQFEELRKLRRPEQIRQALNDLPKGLDTTYDRMFANIRKDDQIQVARVLEWLSFSLRPLLLEEVAEIFILDPNASIPFDTENRLVTPSAVLEFLSGFVTQVPRKLTSFDDDHILRRGGEVLEIRLAHFSIKEYLISSRILPAHADIFGIQESTAHLHIIESCIAYHLHLSQTILATEETVRKYQLWEYVVKYWPKHLDLVPQETCSMAIQDGALSIFTKDSQSLLIMVRIRSSDLRRPDWSIAADMLCSPLYCACSTGSGHLVELLLQADQSSSINEVSIQSRYGTALQLAIVSRHESIVQLLLDKGADVNAKGGFYGNALQAASIFPDLSIVQLLLEKGANVNAQGGEYGNALQAASYQGNFSIVQLLLDKGADVNAQGGYCGNALQAATIMGDLSIVQLLLEKGADVNAQGGHYGNALQAAIVVEEWEIGELLLAKGAKVDRTGPEWEELPTEVGENLGTKAVERLRKLQEDPTIEGLAAIRKEAEDRERQRELKRDKRKLGKNRDIIYEENPSLYELQDVDSESEESDSEDD